MDVPAGPSIIGHVGFMTFYFPWTRREIKHPEIESPIGDLLTAISGVALKWTDVKVDGEPSLLIHDSQPRL